MTWNLFSELLENLWSLANDLGPLVKVWIGPTLWIVVSDSKDIEVIFVCISNIV